MADQTRYEQWTAEIVAELDAVLAEHWVEGTPGLAYSLKAPGTRWESVGSMVIAAMAEKGWNVTVASDPPGPMVQLEIFKIATPESTS